MTLRELVEGYVPLCEQEQADRQAMLLAMDTFGDVLTRANTVCHFTASSWITDRTHTHILMAWHNVYRAWSWTGGHADGDEDLRAVALREAREESVLKTLRLLREAPVSLEMLTVHNHIKRGRFVSSHLHMNMTWLLEADEREPLTVKPDENSGLKWMLPEEAAASPEAEMVPIYTKLNERLFSAEF